MSHNTVTGSGGEVVDLSGGPGTLPATPPLADSGPPDTFYGPPRGTTARGTGGPGLQGPDRTGGCTEEDGQITGGERDYDRELPLSVTMPGSRGPLTLQEQRPTTRSTGA